MVSKLLKRSPAKTTKRTPPSKPLKDLRRSRSPCKKSAAAASVVLSTIDSCQRRLVKLFTKFVHVNTPVRRRRRKRFSYRLLGKASPAAAAAAAAAAAVPRPFLPPSLHPDRKTVFLDLDETLIHSQTDPPPPKFDFIVRPVIDGEPMRFYVLKRPGVDRFLEEAGKRFEVVVFTAGLKAYASLVLDQLDPKRLISHRLYRDSCKETGGKMVKDLSDLGRDLRRVVIVDDNPNAYSLQPENALPVAPFIDDPADGELERVMQFLDVAAASDDLRDALGEFNAAEAPPMPLTFPGTTAVA